MLESSGEIGDLETRESVMKKSRVDADVEISAIEALTNAKMEVDRALDETLHRLLEELPLESEAVTSVAELNSIIDKRVYTEVYESEADAKIISGKWVLKPHKARYVLRDFEEDVKDEDVFVSTTMTASVRMLLLQATDLRNEGDTVFTADVKTAFFRAQVKDGDVVFAQPPPVCGSEQRNSDLEATERVSLWLVKRTETLAGASGADLQEVRLRPERAGHLHVDTHDEARTTRIPRGRLLVGRSEPDHQGNLH